MLLNVAAMHSKQRSCCQGWNLSTTSSLADVACLPILEFSNTPAILHWLCWHKHVARKSKKYKTLWRYFYKRVRLYHLVNCNRPGKFCCKGILLCENQKISFSVCWQKAQPPSIIEKIPKRLDNSTINKEIELRFHDYMTNRQTSHKL